jgi:hypothetical protein
MNQTLRLIPNVRNLYKFILYKAEHLSTPNTKTCPTEVHFRQVFLCNHLIVMLFLSSAIMDTIFSIYSLSSIFNLASYHKNCSLLYTRLLHRCELLCWSSFDWQIISSVRLCWWVRHETEFVDRKKKCQHLFDWVFLG